mgnify:CR=1 FL=1
MANRFFNQFSKTLEKEVCAIYAKVGIGSSGACTLDTTLSKGIVSVTRNSTGKYTFVFGTSAAALDVYNKLLHASVSYDATGASGAAPAAPVMNVVANSIATAGTASIQVQFWGATNSSTTTLVATDPGNGEILRFRFILRNSNAP